MLLRDFLKTSGAAVLAAMVLPQFAKAAAAPAQSSKARGALGSGKPKLTFAFLTDTHQNLGYTNNRLQGFKKALAQVKKLNPSFILLGGDLNDISGMKRDLNLEESEKMYTDYKALLDTVGIPYYATIGNHDRHFDKAADNPSGDALFKKHFGASYRTFEQKGVRFFVLNSVEPSAGNKGLVVGAQQMAWLKSELAKVPADTPIVVSTHVPIYSLYEPMAKKAASLAPNGSILGNFGEVRDAFKKHNLRLVLQGHNHIFEEIYVKKVQYITGGAVSAAWWGGAFHETKEGFLLVNVDEENQFFWEYVEYGWTVPKKAKK